MLKLFQNSINVNFSGFWRHEKKIEIMSVITRYILTNMGKIKLSLFGIE